MVYFYVYFKIFILSKSTDLKFIIFCLNSATDHTISKLISRIVKIWFINWKVSQSLAILYEISVERFQFLFLILPKYIFWILSIHIFIFTLLITCWSLSGKTKTLSSAYQILLIIIPFIVISRGTKDFLFNITQSFGCERTAVFGPSKVFPSQTNRRICPHLFPYIFALWPLL